MEGFYKYTKNIKIYQPVYFLTADNYLIIVKG